MKMQCLRCLSSMFPLNGARGCDFCTDLDVKMYSRTNTIASIHGALPTKFVVVKDPNAPKHIKAEENGQLSLDQEVANAYGRVTNLP